MTLQPLITSRLEIASAKEGESPEAIIIVGPIASGKTMMRKKKFGSGYVHIDSADIFHELSNGDSTLDFPSAFAQEIETVGREMTRLAFDRRLAIVIETPGHDEKEIFALINAFKSVGYSPEIAALSTDRDTCEHQNASRGDNVSSYWAGPIHVGWVVSECAARASA